MAKYQIRKSKIEDKAAVNEAHKRSIREVCSKDYRPDQIEKWSDVTYTDDIWKRSVNENFHYLIEIDGVVEGICHAVVHEKEVGEVMGLYLAPAAIGMGAGREVFEMAMDYLKKHDVKKVIISGTQTAKGFYEHMGFKAKGPVQLHEMRGTAIECFDMEMVL